MKTAVSVVALCLLALLAAACADPPEEEAAEPTGLSASPDPSPTAEPKEKTHSATAPAALEVAGARFITRTVIVGSGTVAAADLDGDGRMDLVAGGEPDLTLFRGDGQGGLAPYRAVPGGQSPTGFALADLDQDGALDIVVANHDTDYLTILLGDGRGAFAPAPESPLRVDVLPHPHAVRAADLDEDGVMDLLVDHRQGEGLLFLKGLGQGNFELPGLLLAAGGDPYRGFTLGDLNGDGHLDAVTPNPAEVGVLLNQGRSPLAFEAPAAVPAETPFAVALADLNGDGRPDLVAASGEGSDLVQAFYGDGTGGFAEAPGSPFRLARGGKSVAVGDFNGDGYGDAAVASYHFADVLLLTGGPQGLASGLLPADQHPWGLAAADFNGDGIDDLLIADDVTGRAIVYLSAG